MPFKFKLSRRLALLKDALLLGLVSVVACVEQGVKVTGPSSDSLTQILVSPKALSVQTDQTAQFMAFGLTSAGDTAQVAISWSVTGGALTDTSSNGRRHYGQYKAGKVPGNYKVVAKNDSGGQADTAAVTVTNVPVASVEVIPASASVTVGGTRQLSAATKDTAGNQLTGRQITWSSSNPAAATVDGSGLVSGVAAGAATITAISESQSGTASITVSRVAVATVAVAPSSADILVGATQQLSALTKDSAGNTLTGRQVTWSSGNSAVATVNASGLVSGVVVGSTTITATSEGKRGTASISVSKVPVAAVTVTPSSASIVIGVTQQLSAVPRDSAGTPLTGRLVTWSSNNATVAAVDGNGVVSGVAVGSAMITATSEGKSGTASLTVTAPPAGGTIIQLTVQRLATGSGAVLVSNGIPLAPGLLRATQLQNVQVVVNSQEQSLYVEALRGTHADGSLRAMLVQFSYTLTAGTPVAGQLILGSARSTADRAKVAPPGSPQAVALPSSPDYLVSTLLGGPLLTLANTPASPQVIADQSKDFKVFDDAKWPSPGAAWDGRGIANYEHIPEHYQEWLRTGDVVMWRRATAMALDYRDREAIPSTGWVSEWYNQTKGLAMHYWLTGDDRSRTAVGLLAEFMQNATQNWGGSPGTNQWMGALEGNDRLRGRALAASIDAWEIEAPTGRYYTGRPILDDDVTNVLNTQRPNGMFGGYDYAWPNAPAAPGGYECCTSQKNYMVGMLLTSLIRYYEEVNPDPRIPPAVKKAVDYMWNTEWVPAAQGFHYISAGYVGDEGDTTPEPGLNVLILPGFAWYYQYSKDPTYQSRAVQILQGVRLNRPNWTNWHQQFDQAYAYVFNCFAWLR